VFYCKNAGNMTVARRFTQEIGRCQTLKLFDLGDLGDR